MSTTVVGSPSKTLAGRRPASPKGHSTAAPVLDAPGSRSAQALAALVGPMHPIRTFLTGQRWRMRGLPVSILLGLLVTRVIIANKALPADDE